MTVCFLVILGSAHLPDMMAPAIILGSLLIIMIDFSSDNYPKATAGKAITGIVVISKNGDQNYNSFGRAILKLLSMFLFGIGPLYLLFSYLFSRKKRGLHDLMSGTVVVWRDSVPKQS